MTHLPSLTDAMPTIRNLHKAAQILGAVRLLLLDHMPNYLELALEVKPEGLSTGLLPFGGEVRLDFRRAALIYRQADKREVLFELAGHNQVTLFEELLLAMQAADLSQMLAGVAREKLIAQLLETGKGLPALKEHTQLKDTSPLEIDMQAGQDYAQVLDTVFSGIARFRGHLAGHMTPMVVWNEHFDLSTLWFVEADMDDHKRHINFGFAPFSEGFAEPYLYAYAYPYPPDMTFVELEAPAYWQREGWTGVVVNYSDIAKQADPAHFVETTCQGIFRTLHKLLI